MREEQTKTTTEHLIFHVDVNSAFLSWESVRRIKEGLPDLRDIPACIGGDPTKRTGIVVAKSIPAKKCGVQTGEPVAMALRKCPNMVIVPSDFDLYVRCSRAFKKICASYTPVMESFSIDEVFLDMTGTSLLYPDPIAAAHEIKDRIYEELGFTVNIGISTNKLLAKMASDFEKPNKVHTLFPEEIPEKMWPLPVRELLFLGKASEKKQAAGLAFILDEPQRMKEKAETVETEVRESMAHRLEQGYILPGQADLLFSSKTILADAHTPHTIFMTGLDQRLPGMTPKAKYSLTGKNLNSYQNSFEILIKDLTRWKKDGYRVVLLSASRTRASRLAGDLREYDLRAFCPEDPGQPVAPGEIMVTYGKLHKGFEYPLIKFVVITEGDMFGVEKRKKKRNRRN